MHWLHIVADMRESIIKQLKEVWPWLGLAMVIFVVFFSTRPIYALVDPSPADNDFVVREIAFTPHFVIFHTACDCQARDTEDRIEDVKKTDGQKMYTLKTVEDDGKGAQIFQLFVTGNTIDYRGRTYKKVFPLLVSVRWVKYIWPTLISIPLNKGCYDHVCNGW